MFYWLDNFHSIFNTSEYRTIMIDDVVWFRNSLSLTSNFQAFAQDGNCRFPFKGLDRRFNYKEKNTLEKYSDKVK